MSYNKLGFTSGQTLKAEHLNYIEEGIANAGGVTSWNDLQDKPFYSEIAEGVAAFDGDPTGKEYFEMGSGMTLVKMSSTPVTKEELIGSTIVIKGMDAIDSEIPNELTISVVEEIVEQQTIDDTRYMLGISCYEIPVVLAIHGDCSAQGMPPEGVYFICIPEAFIYTHSLSCLNGMQEVVHKIDKKYLPEVGLKKEEVAAMIDKAITGAIGGSY